MRCSKCKVYMTSLSTKYYEHDRVMWRRRICPECGRRVTTYEILDRDYKKLLDAWVMRDDT